MTTDELIDLGHKAGTLFVTRFGVASATTEWLEQFAALVASAEREACAKMCENLEPSERHEGSWAAGWCDGTDDCAAAIRARSNT